jgi:hypothetical protein
MLQPDQAEAQPTKAPLKVTQTVRPRVVSARRRKINGIKRSARRMACNGVLESAFLARERAACHTTADRLPATPRSHLRLRFALSVATAAANPSGRGSFAACRVARRLLACAPPRPVSPAQSVPAQMWQGRAQPVPAQMWQGRAPVSPGADVAGASPSQSRRRCGRGADDARG